MPDVLPAIRVSPATGPVRSSRWQCNYRTPNVPPFLPLRRLSPCIWGEGKAKGAGALSSAIPKAGPSRLHTFDPAEHGAGAHVIDASSRSRDLWMIVRRGLRQSSEHRHATVKRDGKHFGHMRISQFTAVFAVMALR